MRALRQIILVATVVLCPCGTQALVITGRTTAHPAQVAFSPCPVHPGYDCLTTARQITLLTTGRNTAFETAWNHVILGEWDPAGWTLDWSDKQIDATLDVSTYRAYCHESGASDGGAEIRIEWTPSAGQTDLRWIQALHTNRPRGYSEWYLDIFMLTPTKPPLYPYQYADQHFYDKPARACDAGARIYWDAYLYLARVDRTNKIATLYEGLQWGFTLDCWAVPEPSSLAALAAAVCSFAMRRRRAEWRP